MINTASKVSKHGIILVHVQFKYGKIRTRKTPYLDTFDAVQIICTICEMRYKVVPFEDCWILFIFLRKEIPFTNLLIYKKQLIKTALFPTILSFSWTIAYVVLYTYPKYIECTLFERSLHYFLFRNFPPWMFLLFCFSALLEYVYWYKGFFVLTQPQYLEEGFRLRFACY